MAKNPTEIHQDMVFKLSSRRSPQEVKLKSFEWAVVTQLDGEKTVAQISDILALSDEEIKEIFHHLMEEGLLELVAIPPEAQPASEDILKAIEEELTLAVGPVAPIIMDDVIKEMRRSRNQLEIKLLPQLIELLSNEISNEEKRFVFERNALKIIKEFF